MVNLTFRRKQEFIRRKVLAPGAVIPLLAAYLATLCFGQRPRLSVETMLRLQTGNFVAGFLPDKAYLPVRGHTLTVVFLDTPGVMPRALSDSGMAADSARRAYYEDLWPGISVYYTLSPKGTCEASFQLAPGADVAQIRLRYNVPARIQRDGTIALIFSSGKVIESSPEAWQERDGRRVAVSVDFSNSNGVVGFTLGVYDHNLPLMIDPVYRTNLSLRWRQPSGKHWSLSTAQEAVNDVLAQRPGPKPYLHSNAFSSFTPYALQVVFSPPKVSGVSAATAVAADDWMVRQVSHGHAGLGTTRMFSA